LTVADRDHALFPDNLMIETNRVHALMLGHDQEAKALSLAHKGEVIKSDNKLWEQNIAEDFAAFRNAGLRHPMMADIEKELGHLAVIETAVQSCVREETHKHRACSLFLFDGR
jgi:hypothetical protein